MLVGSMYLLYHFRGKFNAVSIFQSRNRSTHKKTIIRITQSHGNTHTVLHQCNEHRKVEYEVYRNILTSIQRSTTNHRMKKKIDENNTEFRIGNVKLCYVGLNYARVEPNAAISSNEINSMKRKFCVDLDNDGRTKFTGTD